MSTDKFGRYIIKGEIGHGGMATVFHAYDPSFERDVAIKVLPREFMFTPHFRTRFEREAKMIALLEHPTIVPVYDFGDEDGQPFIVMRYMSGGSLADRLNHGPLSLKETASMFNRLSPALDAAHSRGIIHRDLKPGNILYDQYGNAFLSDFGIARLTQSTGTTITGWTILGTPAYMSPERVQGDREEVDNRSDIYALGVILFQTLTGEVPYDSENPAKVMMMHILEPVPSILARKPDIPQAFEFVIGKAMAKNPDDRYITAGDLALAVEVALRSSAERPPTVPIVAQDSDEAQTTHPPSVTTLAMPPSHVNGAEETTTAVESTSPAPDTAPTKPAIPGLWTSLSRRLMTWRQAAQSLPNWRWFLGGAALVILLGVLAASASSGNGWASFLNRRPTASPTFFKLSTSAPTPPGSTTSEAAGETPVSSPLSTPLSPVIGGADQLAFISQNEIWVANMDGSDIRRITEDGADKNNLQWSADRRAVLYTSGRCIQTVALADLGADGSQPQTITCFEGIQSLDIFELAPDGSLAVLSFDQRELYLVPYQAAQLGSVKSPAELKALAGCETFAPLTSEMAVEAVRWSADGQRLALLRKGADENGQDTVSIIDVSRCTATPPVVSTLTAQLFLFTMRGYSANPHIASLSWDGARRLVVNTENDEAGYGDLYLYDPTAYSGVEINPVGGACCYRDARWSPDGRYLLFVYKDGRTGKIGLYYTQFDANTLLQLPEKFPLPEDLLTASGSSPQPALRPTSP